MIENNDPSEACGSATLFQSALIRLWRSRRLDGGGTLLLKEFLGGNAAQRLQHEKGILERLRGVPGVPELVQGVFPAATIAFADPSAVPMNIVLGKRRLETVRLLEIALELARVVAGIHRAGVAHINLSLDNIFWCRAQDSVMICDFGFATTFAEERPCFMHHRDIAGSLPYLAPEQTGRTGRPVDYRADLYALGAVLYRVTTGIPPFADTDTLQLIHDILAKTPTPPAELDPSLPRGLSRIIMRLLQKEPDRRYQSAEGVAYDLARLMEALAAKRQVELPLGERDFPFRLSPPSRLVGRDAEIAALHGALEKALSHGGGSVLVSGAPGVGKTALINELRSLVAARRGWFISGKFDQYRRDLEADAVQQALRSLGRLLLAEPEAQLAPLRMKILQGLGQNCGISSCLLPEMAAILGSAPEAMTGDALQNKERLVQGAAEILKCVASTERPLVLVLDDLQWAAPTPLALVDALMTEPVPGLFLVAAYRDGDIDAAHPLAPMLSRWTVASNPPPALHLSNLSQEDLAVLLRQMLRLGSQAADELADAIGKRTGGNPYYTVELVNALRREGILVLEEGGWRWDAASIRRYVGGGDLLELLSCRIGDFPPETQTLVHSIACLGGEVPVALLSAATGLVRDDLEKRLVPALEDGLLVLESEGDGGVTFRHDRAQQAAYGCLEHSARLELHLDLARRLASRPDFLPLAAEQYLPAAPLLLEPVECRQVIALLREAAVRVKCINFASTERMLAAALALLERVAALEDDTLLVQVATEYHAALYSLARLDEADGVYRTIADRCSDPVQLAGAAYLQVCSLTNRGLPVEAVAFGLSVLGALGVEVPPEDDLEKELARGLDQLENWVSEVSVEMDLKRPEVTDPRILAVARLINRIIPPAYFSGHSCTNWLVLLGQRLWVEHGPCAALVGPLSHASFMTVTVRENFQAGYRAVRHALAVSDARGYEPDSSQAHFLFSLSSGIWFEPLEENVARAQRSRERLLQGGDLQNACFTYYSSLPALFDCADSLDTFCEELDSSLAFAKRTGNAHCARHFRSTQLLARLLMREADTERALPSAPPEENDIAAAHHHFLMALVGLFFDDMAQMVCHAAESFRLYRHLAACYVTALVHLLNGLALAQQIKSATPPERDALLAKLDLSRLWLEERAADAPENYQHLARLVQAERAWALDDLRGALTAFEAAMAGVVVIQRPWHRALIYERAARCHLTYGLERSGWHLMGEALRHYRSWGAYGKVRQMERAYPFLRLSLRQAAPESSNCGVSSDTVDTLAVLRGSQALSSETNLERLRAQVVALLENMTGATGVTLLLQEEGAGGWRLLPQANGEEAGHGIALEEAAKNRTLPVTIFRYVERTREPLLVHDAKRDDRFAFDPYFFPLECCSVLALPVLNHGALRAVLLLENRLSRGAFSDDRLGAVQLLAGQLSVSLENALLYERLEERVRQRTAELSAAQSQLLATARQAGMAEIATNVLHNVGNVLNSVNISAGVVINAVHVSKAREVAKVAQLVKEHAGDLAAFFSEDKRGRLLPAYLEKLSAVLDEEHRGMVSELSRLRGSVDHIKEIVQAQQSYAGGSSMMEPTRISDLLEDALRMNAVSFQRHQVTVVKDYAELPPFPLDRGRVLQILVNLMSNAKHAMERNARESAVMILKTELADGRLRIVVADRGEGIAPENLLRIFAHGFTTRKGGHGFGLHSCALAAKEMGGTLTAQSAGLGQGAVFTLELPAPPP